MVYGLVERRVRRDGDALIGLKPCGGEDMDLDSRGVESGIGCCGRAVKDEDGERVELEVGSMVEGHLLWRKSQLGGDSDHGGGLFDGR